MNVEPVDTDEAIALKGIEATEAFFRRIRMPTNLWELDVNPTESEFADMARKCALGVGREGLRQAAAQI